MTILPIHIGSKMVQFAKRVFLTDVEVDIRRNGHFSGTKYMPENMSVGALVCTLARGASKVFLTSHGTQDITFMQPEFLAKTLGSYDVDYFVLECTQCADKEKHTCVWNDVNMCIVNEESAIPVYDLLHEDTGEWSDNSDGTITTEEDQSEEDQSEDSLPDLVPVLEHNVGRTNSEASLFAHFAMVVSGYDEDGDPIPELVGSSEEGQSEEDQEDEDIVD